VLLVHLLLLSHLRLLLKPRCLVHRDVLLLQLLLLQSQAFLLLLALAQAIVFFSFAEFRALLCIHTLELSLAERLCAGLFRLSDRHLLHQNTLIGGG
jgi:hypothetical protein